MFGINKISLSKASILQAPLLSKYSSAPPCFLLQVKKIFECASESTHTEVPCTHVSATQVVFPEVNLENNTVAALLLERSGSLGVELITAAFLFLGTGQYFSFLHHLPQITRTELCNPCLRDLESFPSIITSVS